MDLNGLFSHFRIYFILVSSVSLLTELLCNTWIGSPLCFIMVFIRLVSMLGTMLHNQEAGFVQKLVFLWFKGW